MRFRHSGRSVLDLYDRRGHRRRRAALLRRTRLQARRVGSTVELDLAPDLLVGRDVVFDVLPGTTSYLRLGPGSLLEDRVLVQLKGGRFEGGDRIQLRRDVIVSLTGKLTMEGPNTVSWASILHCATELHLEPMAGIAEQCTVADSSHFFTTPDEWFWHNVRVGRIRIGRNTWICPKVTLTRTADIGAYCIVAAGSVVVGTVPDGHLASGVPATVTPMELPWTAAQQ